MAVLIVTKSNICYGSKSLPSRANCRWSFC